MDTVYMNRDDRENLNSDEEKALSSLTSSP